MAKVKIRGSILFEFVTVIIIVVLLLVVTVPAYQKVRITSQNKAITKLLHQGVNSVLVADLVGPDEPIKSLNPVAGEIYPITIYSNDNVIVAKGGSLGDISIDF